MLVLSANDGVTGERKAGESALTICANNVLFWFLMRGNHSAGEEEQRKNLKKTVKWEREGGVERRRGEEETVIISSELWVTASLAGFPCEMRQAHKLPLFRVSTTWQHHNLKTEAFLFQWWYIWTRATVALHYCTNACSGLTWMKNCFYTAKSNVSSKETKMSKLPSAFEEWRVSRWVMCVWLLTSRSWRKIDACQN